MLSGDMQCRLGVILLMPAHVKVLGGEVEALKEANSQEKMLARAMSVILFHFHLIYSFIYLKKHMTISIEKLSKLQ